MFDVPIVQKNISFDDNQSSWIPDIASSRLWGVFQVTTTRQGNYGHRSRDDGAQEFIGTTFTKTIGADFEITSSKRRIREIFLSARNI